MKAILKLCLGSAVLVSSSMALAGPTCTEGPNDNWLSEEAMQAKITEMGFTWDKFKVSRGQCYEIYGHNADGEKVEVYFHPETGEIVKED